MGQLMTMTDSAQLTELLESFYDRIAPTAEKSDWRDALKKNYWEKAIAVGLAGSVVGGTLANALAGRGTDIAAAGLGGSILGAILILALARLAA